NGNTDILSAHISLSYDPNILEVKSVRDAGLLRAGGVSPNLQFTGDGGLVQIQIERPEGMPGVAARGQLVYVQFAVKGQGQSPLTLNPVQTFLRSASGQAVPVKLQSSTIEVR